MRKAEVSKLSDDVRAIKRANSRIKSIAKKYGTDSQVYKNQVSRYMSTSYTRGKTKTNYNEISKSYEGLVHFSDDGVLQISTKAIREYKGADKPLFKWGIYNQEGLKNIEANALASLNMDYDEYKALKPKERVELIKEEAEMSDELESKIGELYDKWGDRDAVLREVPELGAQKGFTDFKQAKALVDKINASLEKSTTHEFDYLKDPRGRK